MGRVLVIHGIVPGFEWERFAHRNLLDSAAFERWLRTTAPCVTLADALAGDGTALTIDDATRAGADAALMARRLGHHVSLFVNPAQVVSGQPYAFVVLNALLDGLSRDVCVFEGQRYPGRSVMDRRKLRAVIKRWLASIEAEDDRVRAIRALADEWGVVSLTPPPHFATLTLAELVALRDAGVDLQNHGWSHGSHAGLSMEASLAEVRSGRAWLAAELGVQARYFAVPFGDVLPQPGAEAACDTWLLSTDQVPYGPVTHGTVFNREELAVASAVNAGGRMARLGRWVADLVSSVFGQAPPVPRTTD